MKYLLFILFASCATGQVSEVESKTFQKTLAMTVNGKAGIGTMTVPVASIYTIVIQIPNKAEIIRLTNCHRSVVVEKSGWFGRTTHTFQIGPISGLENVGSCPIKIDALDVDGANSWGMIDFENEKLRSSAFCNGSVVESNGVSICQGKAGLVQRIIFFEKVDAESLTDNCAKLDPLETMFGFDFTISKGVCQYIFRGKDSHNFNRLTTFGYDTVYFQNVKAANQ